MTFTCIGRIENLGQSHPSIGRRLSPGRVIGDMSTNLRSSGNGNASSWPGSRNSEKPRGRLIYAEIDFGPSCSSIE